MKHDPSARSTQSGFILNDEPAALAPVSERMLNPGPRWALYAFMFSLPYDVLTPSWLPASLQGNLSIPRIIGVILILAFLLSTSPRLWRLPRAFVAFAAFFLVFAFSMLRTDLTTFAVVFQQFQMIVLFAVAYNLFLTGRVIRNALLAFSISCGVSSVLIITGTTVDVYQVDALGGRVSGFGADPNIYSAILVVGVIAAIGVGHFRKKRSGLIAPVLWAIAFVTVTAVALSGSRGSTLALAVGLATFMLSNGSLRSRLRRLAILAVVATAALWMVYSTPVLGNRWQETFRTGSTSGRDVIALQAITMVKERPFLGWGAEATSVLGARLSLTDARSTHNMPLAMLTFVGLLGALPYFFAYFAVFWAAWRARGGKESVLPLAVFMAMFVTDMVTGGLPDKLHWMVFAYVLAAGRLADMVAQPDATGRRMRLAGR